MPALISSVFNPRGSSVSPGDYELYGSNTGTFGSLRQLPSINGVALEDTTYNSNLPPAPIFRPKLPPLEIQGAKSSSMATINSDIKLPDRQRIYGPVLPPIRVPQSNPTQIDRDSQATRATQPSVESVEKVGGVAAHLDYDMDTMVDFVTDMAQGMYSIFTSSICLADIDISRSVVHSRASPAHGLRKFVLQVLSSTRLPSSTILLGLLYMSKRMANLSQKKRCADEETRVHSMLIVALILGSKFLDDNTFQNRSWSEVSGLSVTTLNLMEFQWLADIEWDMHINQEDPDGFRLWRQHWFDFENRRADASLADSLRQTQLSDGCCERQMSSRHWLSPASPIASQQGMSSIGDRCTDDATGLWTVAPAHNNIWPHARPELTPPSAPETGPATPDIYNFLEFDACGSVNVPRAFNARNYPFQFYSAGTPAQYCAPQLPHRYGGFTGPCFDGCPCHSYQDIPFMACAR